MSRLFARYHKVAKLAESPTPLRRGIAAAIAGCLAFGITQFLLGVVWGAGATVLWLSSMALAVAAAYAAITMRKGIALVYGLLAVIWLLGEGFAVLASAMMGGLG